LVYCRTTDKDEYRQNEKPLRETGKTLVGVLYSITSHGVEKRCEEKIRVEKSRKKEETFQMTELFVILEFLKNSCIFLQDVCFSGSGSFLLMLCHA
jgi:hypothetical protein